METKSTLNNDTAKITRYIELLSQHTTKSSSEITNTLLKLREFSKIKTGIEAIISADGIVSFVSLLQRPNRKIIDITSSILANCLTNENARIKVLDCKGIPVLVRVLQSIQESGVVSRTCRAVANLAANKKCSQKLHNESVIPLLTSIIRKSDQSCISSALRALRHLADSPHHRKTLVTHGCVVLTANLLVSKDKEILTSSVRLLSTLSRTCTLTFADQMLGRDYIAIKQLVAMAKGKGDDVCQAESLTILINLTRQSCARPAIGNAGGIPCFLGKIQEYLTSTINLDASNYLTAVTALCYCCRDACNRIKLHDTDAFSILMNILRDDSLQQMHAFVIASLVYFVYHEDGLAALHDKGLFSILLKHLLNFINGQTDNMTSSTDPMTSKNDLMTSTLPFVPWDGFTEPYYDTFDDRFSLSFDVSTKFNQRPSDKQMTLKDTNDDLEPLWKHIYYGEEPMSPQWSPMMGSRLSNFQKDAKKDDFAESDDDEDSDSVDADEEDSPIFPTVSSEILTSILFEQPSVKRMRDEDGCHSNEEKRRRSDQGQMSTATLREAIASPTCSKQFLDFVYDTTCNLTSKIPTSTSSEIKFSKKKKIDFKTDNKSTTSTASAKDTDCETSNKLNEQSTSIPIRRSLTAPTELDQSGGSVSQQQLPGTRIDHIIINLLCHYCETSDSYVVSLANCDELSSVIYQYITKIKDIYEPRFYRILISMLCSPEAYVHVLCNCIVPTLCTAHAVRCHNDIQKNKLSSSRNICSTLQIYDDSLHHCMFRYVIVQVSKFGSNELAKVMTSDINKCTLSVLNTAIWLLNTNSNNSTSMKEGTAQHIEALLKQNWLDDLLDELMNEECEYKKLNITLTLVNLVKVINKNENKNKWKICTADKTKCKDNCKYNVKCQESKTDKTLICDETQDTHKLQIHSDILSDKSPVLKTMFQGQFKESISEEVKLHDVCYGAVIYAVHSMYGCTIGTCKTLHELNVKENHGDQYEKLQKSGNTPSSLPLELATLDLWHMWCMDSCCDDYINDNFQHFKTQYINKELNSIVTFLKSNESSDKSQTPFFYFIVKYNNSRLINQYMSLLFKTCTFDHHHLSQCNVIQFLLKYEMRENILSFLKPCLSQLLSQLQSQNNYTDLS